MTDQWKAEETARLAPILRALASARASWEQLTRGAYGSPEFPNYTALINGRKAKGKSFA